MGQSTTTASHGNVHEFASELGLDEAAYRRAIELAGLTPDRQQWLRYLDRFLTGVGALLIVAGVTAFFAWNWAGLGPMHKFGLIQIGIMGSVVVAWRLGIDSVGGRSSLLAAGFLIGVLLAVFGQVYQTGADPYGLFLGWAVLMLPFSIIGRQSGLWLLTLVLLNLGLIMYWTQVLHPPNDWWQLAQLLGPVVWLATTMTHSSLAGLVFALNALALLSWEFAADRGIDYCQGRTFPRMAALLALCTVVIPTLIMVFAAGLDEKTSLTPLSPVLFLAAVGCALVYYQFRKLDLLILTLCLLGAIMVVTALCIRFMFEGFESTLLLAFLLIAQTAGAAYWLRDVARRWEISQ